jgi:lipopolysaccharide export system protein LptA
MRGTRWLLLVAILAIVGGVGFTYRAQRKVLRDQAPAKPAALPDDLNSTAQNWTYTETNANHTTVEITAGDFKEAKDSSHVDLKNLILKSHNKNGETYDLIKSAAATFYKAEHRFYSEGEVEITLNVPEKGEPKHALTVIRSSGVTFDTNTEHTETDRHSSFSFENGQGEAVGAFYDPATRELRLKQDVKLDWKPIGPHAKPMRIEAGSLEYHQAAAEVQLKPWGRLTRDTTVVEGENAVIHLQDAGEGHKSIRKIEAVKAHGSDTYPNRKLQYAAEQLWVDFDDDGAVQKITGQTNARLVATGETSETTVTAYHVDMNFDPQGDQSLLTGVSASGNSVVASKPLPGAGRQLTETHILRSEKLDMKMRDGGKEIESVSALTPGSLEFLPNLPVQHHRTLDGKDMFIAYGPQNRIESFRANDVRTKTDPTADEIKRKIVTSTTSSKSLRAWFEPKTSKLAGMEQNGDFSYEEGDRKARAAKASLDSEQNVILLESGARMWDATGSTSADHIRMDQRTGDFTAEGNVNSSRMPDKDQKKNSQMLSGDEPLQAQARRMDSSNHNRKIHYEGNVLMWQGANRIQAGVVDLDREKRILIADGNVVTNLWEEPKDEQKKKTATPVLTEVHAPHLVYTEEDRRAYYTGGVFLTRPALQVKARELQAYLADSGADSRLQKAYADGAVQIVQKSPTLTRTGTAEHSEFYTEDQRVILTGGMPKLVDSKGSSTTGPHGLTYYANDDRLQVNGSETQPTVSRIKGKK